MWRHASSTVLAHSFDPPWPFAFADAEIHPTAPNSDTRLELSSGITVPQAAAPKTRTCGT
jgi:hypothetical protein